MGPDSPAHPELLAARRRRAHRAASRRIGAEFPGAPHRGVESPIPLHIGTDPPLRGTGAGGGPN
ncbi:hypothetical protein GCM10022226_49750 [Sphaerisporangium flaviroseum]|uniref:Uncharacterized protein n=1 Tax=Sphaerisporangium flaviroseum TaxID=509199 RepID=A0ABP7IP95_9ACTN